jgi:hypothetical protein
MVQARFSDNPGSVPPVDAAGGARQVSRAILALRLGLGAAWTLNLLFVVDPANQFFPTFASTARSFRPTTIGGGGWVDFVSSNAQLFAALVAGITLYLAVAFLFGLTVRGACFTGAAFNVTLLLTQIGSVVVAPGGTDIGPQPLYLVMYAALLLAPQSSALSIDGWLSEHRSAVRGLKFGRSASPTSSGRPTNVKTF